MTFLQIWYFIEVCRLGSTLKASQSLNVSQSTVSTSIRNLESELNVSLFDRTSKGMKPNVAGVFFLERCQEILKKTQDLKTEMEQFSVVRRPVRLGLPVQMNQIYWSDLYFQLKKEFPDWEFQSINRTVPVLMEMLKNNELDGIIFMRHNQELKDHFLILREEQCRYVAMSRSNPLAGKSSVSYQQLANYPILRYAGDDLQAELIAMQYQLVGVQPKYGLKFDQFSSLLQFLRKDAGIAFIHREVIKPYPDLVSIPIQEENRIYPTYLVWNKYSLLARGPKRLIQVIQKLFLEWDS